MREKINLRMNFQEIMRIMCEGNPGAIEVTCRILQEDHMKGMFVILGLDDMNIRGSKIWVGFKDFCNSDLKVFKENIHERSAEMVKCINEYSGSKELAVTQGASFRGGHGL